MSHRARRGGAHDEPLHHLQVSHSPRSCLVFVELASSGHNELPEAQLLKGHLTIVDLARTVLATGGVRKIADLDICVKGRQQSSLRHPPGRICDLIISSRDHVRPGMLMVIARGLPRRYLRRPPLLTRPPDLYF